MSRLVVPVTDVKLWHTGDVLLRLFVELHLKDESGGWKSEEFRVDTGADLTTFPAYDAKQLGIPIPGSPAAGVTHTQTGLEIRSGILRFRIDGMDATEYAIFCLFLGDPDTPPNAAQKATLPRKLLQPLQLVDRLRFTEQKDPTLGNLYGEMVIEKV